MQHLSNLESTLVQKSRIRIHQLFQKFGFDVFRHPLPGYDYLCRKEVRAPVLAEQQITLVLDVGANIGKYAQEIRRYGYLGRMISFEPLAAEYQLLAQAAKRDGQWKCRQLALGGCDGPQVFHVAANSQSSSLLPMCESHREAEPQSAYVGTQQVAVARLDSIASTIMTPDDHIWLKLDVQGYELEVLSGAPQTLSQVRVIECELSLVTLYEGQPLFAQMVEYFESKNFTLVSLENGFRDPRSHRLLQLDGVFVRNS